MSIIIATEENFSERIKEELILVKFGAPWCGPCKMIDQVLQNLESILPMNILSVDVDENEMLAKQYGVRGIPTLMMFNNGSVSETKVGALSASELQTWIESFTQ